MPNAPIILEVQCIACDKTLQKIEHNPKKFAAKMRNAAGRRMRTPNWSPNEKQYLLELIKEKKDIVASTSASNTGPHSEERMAAWNDIMMKLIEKFGSKFAGSTIKKVKTQWQNMKRIAREELTARIVSQQSMEVCRILDGQSEMDSIKEEVECGPSTSSSAADMKRELPDKYKAANFVTMNVTPAEFTTTVQVTEDPTLSDSSIESEYVQLSDADDPMLVTNKKTIERSCDLVHQNSPRPRSSKSSNRQKAGTNAPWRGEGAGDANDPCVAAKKLKQEMLTEERQVLRAMRETAELNKIIAEHRLKHMLWLSKHEQAMYSGEPGSGAGRGGGGGGAIREAGGSFGKMEAVREDEYFYKKQREQLKELKTHLDEEISFHEEEIRRHQDAIKRHKEKVSNIDNAQN